MKTCNRFHFSDLEKGDILHCAISPSEVDDDWLEANELPSRVFTGRLTSRYTTQNFGKILELKDTTTNQTHTIYLEDGWELTYVPATTITKEGMK